MHLTIKRKLKIVSFEHDIRIISYSLNINLCRIGDPYSTIYDKFPGDNPYAVQRKLAGRWVG